jgi:hypothetical protein
MAPLKSSLARTVGKLLGVQKDRDLSLRGRKQSSRITEQLMAASGGTEYTIGNYKYHIYQSPQTGGTLNVSSGGAGQILVLAGAGAGAPDQMGGGGGGAVVFSNNPIQFEAVNYPITVGAGGASSPYGQYGAGQKGQTSSFGSSPQNIYLIALGGGGAKSESHPQPFSDNAGCGGGGGNNNSGGFPASQPGQPQTAPTPVVSTGFQGGAHPGDATGNNTGSGGGGGGAGTVGRHGGPPAPAPTRGVGGDGYQVPSDFLPTDAPASMATTLGGIPTGDPAWRYFGAGGGGADNNNNAGTGRGFGAPGGLGNPGGRGCVDPGPGGIPGSAGTNHRAGGGGGGSTHSGIGGAGGSGLVIVRYKFQ